MGHNYWSWYLRIFHWNIWHVTGLIQRRVKLFRDGYYHFESYDSLALAHGKAICTLC